MAGGEPRLSVSSDSTCSFLTSSMMIYESTILFFPYHFLHGVGMRQLFRVGLFNKVQIKHEKIIEGQLSGQL